MLWMQAITPAVSRKGLLAGKPPSLTFTALLKKADAELAANQIPTCRH